MQEKNRNTDREERLYRRFAEYAAIPHPSGNTAAASEYCLEAAASAGYCGERDAAGNLLIRVPYLEHLLRLCRDPADISLIG